MYEYDPMLNGKSGRDAYAEKLHNAENARKANSLTKKNGISNVLTYIINIFS